METNTNTKPTTTSGYTAAERQEIAATILAQINAGDFWARARWGVKQMVATEHTPQGAGRPQPGLLLNCTRGIKILVTLAPSDTYTVELGRLGRETFDLRVEGRAEDVYAEDLARAIDREFSAAFGSL